MPAIIDFHTHAFPDKIAETAVPALAAKGKVGAEEVAGVLTTVFTELLTVAADLGADMLKFGGDALLLLFTGPEHSLRAVRASGEMRLRLRSVGKISTPDIFDNARAATASATPAKRAGVTRSSSRQRARVASRKKQAAARSAVTSRAWASIVGLTA